MLAEGKNPELYLDWSNFIEELDTRLAFWYMVGVAACSSRFYCHPKWNGVIRSFRFYDSPTGASYSYSFITNKKWLKFYFRHPEKNPDPSLEMLDEEFGGADQTPKGEFTVKLRNVDDVRRLLKYIRWNEIDRIG